MDFNYRRTQALGFAVAAAERGENPGKTLERADTFFAWISAEADFDEKIRHLSPKAQEWLRKNPECLSNPGMHAEMLKAAQLAYASGITSDTDAYFSFIESKLGINRNSATVLSIVSEKDAPK